MKKVIQLLIFISLSLISIAENPDNNQKEWFPLGAEWYYESGYDFDPHTIPVVEHYVVEKDTIVEGKSCKLIRSSGTSDIMFEENGDVYYYFKGKFRKIFDFSVSVNDIVNLELKADLNNDFTLDSTVVLPCIIEKIDTVYVGDVSLKRVRARYNTVFGQGLYIYIEKVGCEIPGMFIKDFVPFLIPGIAYIPESYRRLRCYHDKYFDFITDWWHSKNLPCDKYYEPQSDITPKRYMVTDTLFRGMDIKKIVRDSNDTLWLVSNGFYKSNGDSIWKYSVENYNLLSENIRDIAIDSGDTIWMITENGLLKFDHKKFTAIDNQSIHYNNLVIDKEDNIWLSKTSGVVKYDKKSWQVYTKENSEITSSIIQSMVADSERNIWIATCDKVNEGSIIRINGDEWTVFNRFNTVIPIYYFMNNSLAADKDANVYAKIDYSLSSSTNIGKPKIIKYNGYRWSVIDSVSGIMDLTGFIGCGEDNTFWKRNSSSSKLSYFNGSWNEWAYFNHTINNLFVGANGGTWFCTNNGVYVVKSENVETIFNQIGGIWYKNYTISGLTGKKDTVYSNEVNEIKRISGTDSLIWTVSENDIIKNVSRYRLVYADSYLYGEKRWMLTGGGFKLIIETDSNVMTCGIDAYDAGAVGYSRKKSLSGFNLPWKNEFRYYFDPFGSVLNISGVTDVEYVSFFELNGRLIQKVTPLPNGSFDIHNLKKGLYIIRVVSKNMVYPGKIIK